MVESARRDVAAMANWLCGLAFVALIAGCGVAGQDEFKEVKNVGDLWNTSSCIEPPFACPHPRIQFFLYTRYTQESPDLLDTTDPNSLYASHFNPSHPTKVIIHGFQGGRNLAPSTDLRDAYFKRGNYNIIIVDYSTLVKLPCLSQMEWSPRFCGQCIAQMVDYLAYHPRGVPPDSLHLMGYSIGAHIAGLTANFVQEGKLGRITGLDPTIIFYMANNRSKDLDPSDAHFVDVIHTGAGVLGQWGPNGHADFYVNGGTSQPGCTSNSIIIIVKLLLNKTGPSIIYNTETPIPENRQHQNKALLRYISTKKGQVLFAIQRPQYWRISSIKTETLSCDHTKVTPYFIESINSEAGFWSVPCSNRFLFSLGFCNPPVQDWVLMGEHANPKIRGIFYLTTNANPPYAQGLPGRFRPKTTTRRQRQSKRT